MRLHPPANDLSALDSMTQTIPSDQEWPSDDPT